MTEAPPPRLAGKLSYVMAGEIVPDFWSPGLVDGVLETQAMTIVYGPSGSGKTAVVVDLACRIAAGMPWRGREVQQGLVIYVAAENSESTGRRIWAWQQRHKTNGIPLAMVRSPVTMGAEAVQQLAGLIRQVEEETGSKTRLLIFDTLARTMGGDENVAKDMGEYVKALDAIKVGAGAHVLVVHHTGKDEGRGARGSSALKAATDHELEVYKERESRIGAVKLSKVREGDLEGTRFGFELMPRQLGVNKLGRMVTTVVIEEAEAPKKTPGKRTSDTAGRVRDALDTLGGRVTLEELRLEVGDISTGNAESERKAWRRLFEDGYLEKTPQGYIVLGPGRRDTDIS